MNGVFHSSGLVTATKIVGMDPMKWIVRRSNVNRECFNAETIRHAFQEFEFVMESRIVAIRAMNRSAIVIVDNIVSNAKAPEDVFRTLGSATVSIIVFFILVFQVF